MGSTIDEFGRRVRAARAYAGLSQEELAHAIKRRHPGWEVSLPTVKRLEKHGAGGVKGSEGEWGERVAEACGVPLWFLERGFDGGVRPEDGETLERRVAVLEHLIERLVAPEGEAVPAPSGELGRRLGVLSPSRQGTFRAGSAQAAVARSDSGRSER